MNYTEFKELLPSAAVTEEQFNSLLPMAEAALAGYVCRSVGCLSGEALETYKLGLCLQIDHMHMYGSVNSGVISQTVNGVTVTVKKGRNTAQGEINVSPAAVRLFWAKGLSIC